jgi:hypothetical protein
MELRFDSSAGGAFSDAKCDLVRWGVISSLLIAFPGTVSFNGWKINQSAL